MKIKTPIPLTQWKSSDGKIHPTEELARRHEVFLVVKDRLPNGTDGKVAHSIICFLASMYDFVERKPANLELAAEEGGAAR